MSKIIITRSSEWSNRARAVAIYLDDEKLGTVANGAVETFEVPPGLHKLRAKMDWCGSREEVFTIHEGETKYFKLSGFKYSTIIMPAFSIILVLHLLLKNFAGIKWVIWAVIPFFLVMLYYITIGRKDYLLLKPAQSF